VDTLISTNPQFAYRWHEGDSDEEVSSYFSLSPFTWYWLKPYKDCETRTLYMVDLRHVRKYPCHMREWISKIPRPWETIKQYYDNEFIIKAKVHAFKVGTDIERLIMAKDDYFNYLFETKMIFIVHPGGELFFDQEAFSWWMTEKGRIEKLWEQRIIALCQKRYLALVEGMKQ